ncbi:Hypothetical predicted protein [Pelobates cultripes]|uniref:Uncharacterized protein n=1 Tax=Pelobates cultripes TaxID=61616 RepID=A0AAD1SFW0_PELCU|nr:Hypothetical predicted protein [Pelobates cultripes]
MPLRGVSVVDGRHCAILKPPELRGAGPVPPPPLDCGGGVLVLASGTHCNAEKQLFIEAERKPFLRWQNPHVAQIAAGTKMNLPAKSSNASRTSDQIGSVFATVCQARDNQRQCPTISEVTNQVSEGSVCIQPWQWLEQSEMASAAKRMPEAQHYQSSAQSSLWWEIAPLRLCC